MAKIKIVYGSAGGNTELVCEKVTEILVARGHEVEMLKAKLTDPVGLIGAFRGGEFDLLILASPTYGHGQLEQYIAGFMAKMENVDLKGLACAVIGLGDPKYDSDYHIESIKVIMDFLKRKEARIVGMPLRVSRCPLPLISGHVDKWAEKMATALPPLSGVRGRGLATGRPG